MMDEQYSITDGIAGNMFLIDLLIVLDWMSETCLTWLQLDLLYLQVQFASLSYNEKSETYIWFCFNGPYFMCKWN
jgi:hypothetical protein